MAANFDHSILEKLGIHKENSGVSTGKNRLKGQGDIFSSHTPVDGSLIARVRGASREEYDLVMEQSLSAFKEWRTWPAPKRGEIVRQIGNELRKYKDELGRLVSYEMGKSLQEGWGEVQEMIDICDFAVGQSRMLYGMTTTSERPDHRLFEQWHPLGPVGVISAFNFPVAVWAWNAMIAFVCGDTVVWKPSEKVPLCGIACQNIIRNVFERNGVPEGVSSLVVGDYKVGELMTGDKRMPLVSATGSIPMGKKVGAAVASRLGRSILELGGNNAIIISESADLEMALPAIVFGAVGTCGQRCTSTRRLIIHESIYDKVKEQLRSAYGQLKIGNPLDEEMHVGPLIDRDAVNKYLAAIEEVKSSGGRFVVEGGVLEGEGYESGLYVKPCIAEVENEWPIVQEETFAPILYLIRYKDFDEAIAKHNGVRQGLSSAIMSTNMRETERFISASGSDCGIANINIGTSGAEIGGAFGGEKETGGGRESGSDAWKAYMRRQTNTVNYGNELPLAQGIKFVI